MRWLWLFLGLLAALALAVWLLPLRWLTDRYVPGLEAQAVEGSIWDARIRGARYQGLWVGDVDAGLAPGPLLAGRAEVAFVKLDGLLEGRLVAARRAVGLTGLAGTVALPVLPRPLPPVQVGVKDVTLRLGSDGRCLVAAGRVTAGLGALPGVGALPALAGDLGCDGPVLRAPLASADGRVGLDLSLAPGGAWTALLRLEEGRPAARAALAVAGFRPDGAAMTWSAGGTAGA